MPIHRVWLRASQGNTIDRFVTFLSFALLCPLALRRASSPDIVFVNSTPLIFAPTARIAARLWNAKSILSLSDLWPDSIVDIGMVKEGRVLNSLVKAEKFIYSKFDIVNGVTDGICKVLVEEKEVAADRLTALPNGVDVDQFRPDATSDLPAELAKDLHESSLFVFPGTMGLFNGLDVVIQAMERLSEIRPDIRFAFVGDGSDRSRIESMVNERGLPNVKFFDPVSSDMIAGLLPRITAGVVTLKDMPVTRGARPAKMFPILASARPVIFVGAGEAAELVESGGCGLVVPPADAAGLADAMIRLTDDQLLADELGSRGLEFVRREFSYDALVGSWLSDVCRILEMPEPSIVGSA